MPEAAEKGWVGFVPLEELPLPLQCLPFLRARRALTRHATLAIATAAVWIPAGLTVLTLLMSLPLKAMTLATFAGFYVFSVSFVVMPIGILGFCVQDNYDRAVGMMSMSEQRCARLVERIILVPFA